MADNATLPFTGSGDATAVVAADEIGGVKHQRVKVQHGVDGVALDASDTNPFPVYSFPKAAGTATVTSVSDTASSAQLLAANTARLGVCFFNESSSTLYLKLGTTASVTSYTVEIPTMSFYEVPFRYTGRIDGIWSADSTGAVRITELTA